MGIRILIASDHALSRTGLRQILTTAPDCAVVAEAHGLEGARALARKYSPSVVVFEITVPGEAGLRTASALVDAARPAHIVVVAGNENMYYVRSLLAAGVVGYVLRKASQEELFQAVRNAHSGTRYLDPRLSDGISEMLLQRGKAQAPPRPGGLSGRELQVLRAVVRGFTSAEIGRQLRLSAKTVETYRGRIYEKLGLHTRADLVQYATAAGLGEEM